jgi:hypothetical protein
MKKERVIGIEPNEHRTSLAVLDIGRKIVNNFSASLIGNKEWGLSFDTGISCFNRYLVAKIATHSPPQPAGRDVQTIERRC